MVARAIRKKKYPKKSQGPSVIGRSRQEISEEMTFQGELGGRRAQPGEGNWGNDSAFQVSPLGACSLGSDALRCPHAGWKHGQQWDFSCTWCKECRTLDCGPPVQAYLCQSAV